MHRFSVSMLAAGLSLPVLAVPSVAQSPDTRCPDADASSAFYACLQRHVMSDRDEEWLSRDDDRSHWHSGRDRHEGR